MDEEAVKGRVEQIARRAEELDEIANDVALGGTGPTRRLLAALVEYVAAELGALAPQDLTPIEKRLARLEKPSKPAVTVTASPSSAGEGGS